MTGQQPFARCLGYALLRDENGEEMHKSKGNAIWFEDAAEEMGADVMRWMFSQHEPGRQHQLRPARRRRGGRRFFLPLWNTYAFFVTYARTDGWTPRSDRWRRRRPARSWTAGSLRA